MHLHSVGAWVGDSGVYLSDTNVQGLFSCGNLGGLSWSSIMNTEYFTSPMSSHPPFCSHSTATASASTAASTEFAAAGAASRSTAAAYDLDDDDEDDVVEIDDEDEDDGDDSVVLVGKKPAARSQKASFKCISGEVLRVMQD